MKNYWSLRLSKFTVLVLLLASQKSPAQYGGPERELGNSDNASTNYLFPIEPGTPNLLAGTMGELRSNHFHSGIDIRTNGRIGVPVLSAQQGYVSRISISPGGYGNAIYVTHPNGHTSVYGHLDRFDKKISDYVRKEQYRKKTFAINLNFSSGTFPVNKGDTIAYSGNSGSSSGPHLHFDIRDKNNEALNPLIFNFSEVVDTTPPVVQKIALRTMDINSRINDQFGRFVFYVVREENNYRLPYPILAYGNIGIEFLGYDKLDNSRAKCGINDIEVLTDNERIFRQVIDKVNFAVTRNILTLMDYPTMMESGERFNKLYIDDGNDLNYYESLGKGTIRVNSKEVPVTIKLKDSYNNESLLSFTLKPSTPVSQVPSLRTSAASITFNKLENIMEVRTVKTLGDSLVLFHESKSTTLGPVYASTNQNVFLFDLRDYLPDSIKSGDQKFITHLKDRIPSAVTYNYYSDVTDITFPKGSLYDTMYLAVTYQNVDDEIFSIGDVNVPLNRSINITLKPKIDYKESYAVYRKSGRYPEYIGGAWSNGKIAFSTRSFGDFVLMEDTSAPTIFKMAVNGAAARFRIKDDLSGIAYYEASINGEWLLMNYDPKTSMIWAERLDQSKPLQGDLRIKVVDNAGNENIYQQIIP